MGDGDGCAFPNDQATGQQIPQSPGRPSDGRREPHPSPSVPQISTITDDPILFGPADAYYSELTLTDSVQSPGPNSHRADISDAPSTPLSDRLRTLDVPRSGEGNDGTENTAPIITPRNRQQTEQNTNHIVPQPTCVRLYETQLGQFE